MAERFFISPYQKIIRWIGDSNAATRQPIESILEKEERAHDLNNLFGN